MDYKNSDINLTNEFKKVMKRMTKAENLTRYKDVCTASRNGDEERIWSLCQAFWSPDYECRSINNEDFSICPTLNHALGVRYINELNRLLDKLGWER